MKRFISSALLSAGLLLVASWGVHAQVYGGGPYQNDPNYRNNGDHDRHGNSGYANNGYGRYGNSGSIVDRVLSDLDRAGANSRTDGHERGHFATAQQSLLDFQSRWAQGQFDTGRLDVAINSLKDLANSNQIDPRERSVLSSDLAALRQFRASRGRAVGSNSGLAQVYGEGPYRNDPYYRNSGDYNPHGNSGYANNGYGRYGNSGSIVDRVLSDLNQAAANSRTDRHENGHFATAQQSLLDFQSRWAQGQFDTGRLDMAINSLKDLANSNQIDPRERSVLSSDLAALRQFRVSRGQTGRN